jgi:Transposase DDE domain
MEHQLWKAIVAVLATLDKKRFNPHEDFTDRRIVQVFYWAVIHDRPVTWACRRASWPIHLRRHRLPSDSTMSVRLRTPSVRQLLEALERRVTAPAAPGLLWLIDGLPLLIGGASKDRHAGYGRAARGMALGYKLHAILNTAGIAAWRIAPLNKDERTMAQRLVRIAGVQGYLVGDANYDSNPLHDACIAAGELQLLTPRRYGSGHHLGHRRHSPGRLRSIARTESPFPAFAARLLHDRKAIERAFGQLTNWGGGLTTLPPWVRTYPRVHRWVQAKLTLTYLKRSPDIRTCAS